jgi:hypothetical protein
MSLFFVLVSFLRRRDYVIIGVKRDKSFERRNIRSWKKYKNTFPGALPPPPPGPS